MTSPSGDSGCHVEGRKPFQCLLPGGGDVWIKSPLQSPDAWPHTLQALTVTLSSFDYPAAIFWGEELTLLYNQAWEDAGGIHEQGRSQRGSLSADAWAALSQCIHGGKPSRITSHALLREDEREREEEFTVLASPLFDTDATKPKGVLAQMLQMRTEQVSYPRRASQLKPQRLRGAGVDKLRKAVKGPGLGSLGVGTTPDDIPLDEHPFFHRFAEMLPTGLAILDHNAQAVFVNQHFYQLTTHQGDDKSFRSWPQSIHPDDYERVLDLYKEAFHSGQQMRAEFRALGKEHPWRLLLLTPLGDENLRHVSLGEYGGFICSIVDITSEKSAELSQRQAAEEALERKQQQERFIDMISHEIRNPLSAVLHCVEDIDEAIRLGENDHGAVDTEQISEALETINLCISHQKNIVDDVLSYSKLDSSMLSLAPKPTHIDTQIRRTLKMFQPEFRKQNLEFEYCIDEGYTDMGIDWAMADVPRIGQVLINLISNAIKFTSRAPGARRITCRLSASTERPVSYPPDVVFFNTENHVYRLDATEREEWGEGEPFYLLFAIADTGIGISDEGQKRLFERFKQATPKTGEIYGGSGLGLNISRKLVHLHGGEIGVASKEGQGTTFGFFFRARRAQAPVTAETSAERAGEDDRLRSQMDARGVSSLQRSESEQSHASLEEPAVKKVEEHDEDDGRIAHTKGIVQGQAREEEAGREKKERDLKWRSDRQESLEKIKAREGAALTDDSASPRHKTQSLPDRSRPSTQKDSQEKCQQGEKPHVLLVEDNVINQRLLQRKLATKGFRVTTANNGQEAVDAFSASLSACSSSSSPPGEALDGDTGKEGAIDVILMDQEMPVLDGNGASRAIRALESERGGMQGPGSCERVPILGVSANVREDQLEGMLDSGMDGYLTKPYKIVDMIAKIHEMIGGNKDGADGAAGG